MEFCKPKGCGFVHFLHMLLFTGYNRKETVCWVEMSLVELGSLATPPSFDQLLQ